jgi:hypothetical protein
MGIKRFNIATNAWVDYRPVVNQGNNTVPNIPAKRAYRSAYYPNPQPTEPDIHVWELIGDYIPPEVAPSTVGVMTTTPGAPLDPHNLYSFWAAVSSQSDDRYKYWVLTHFMDSGYTVRAERDVLQTAGGTQSNYVFWDPTVWGNFVRVRLWYRNLNGVGPFAEGTLTL